MRYRDRVDGVCLEPGGLRDGMRLLRDRGRRVLPPAARGEIIEQVVLRRKTLATKVWGGLGNIVLMGMGEPLANYERSGRRVGR